MPRTEGLKPIGDSIRKIIDKVIEERKKRKKNRPVRTQPKLPGLNKGGGADTGRVGEQRSKVGVAVNRLSRKMRNKDRLTNRDKELAKELIRKPQSRNKMQPSRSMSIDTTTGISKMKEGGICRGAGAAIKGTKFQGVF
tara:strand:- start:605 stop:1021 length:417 start_codon:yes stop_codon:yes gene_type:complete